MPKPHGAETRGAATKGASIPLIISAATIDGNQCHQEICESLIPRTSGWENLFLREISKLRTLSATQREKLNKIAARYEQEKAARRICRYCQGVARIVDEYSYFCLNLDWQGGAK